MYFLECGLWIRTWLIIRRTTRVGGWRRLILLRIVCSRRLMLL